MSTRRTIRVSEAVRMELANLFTRERSLEGIILTISSVDVTPDLKNAHIFLSVLEHALSQESILALLNKKRHEWQSTRECRQQSSEPERQARAKRIDRPSRIAHYNAIGARAHLPRRDRVP